MVNDQVLSPSDVARIADSRLENHQGLPSSAVIVDQSSSIKDLAVQPARAFQPCVYPQHHWSTTL
jgi:hypothetical protein